MCLCSVDGPYLLTFLLEMQLRYRNIYGSGKRTHWQQLRAAIGIVLQSGIEEMALFFLPLAVVDYLRISWTRPTCMGPKIKPENEKHHPPPSIPRRPDDAGIP